MIKIVQANTEHCEALAEIGKKSFLEAHGHSASKEDIDAYVTKNFNSEVFHKELANSNNIYYLIYHNNQVAGYSKIILNFENINIVDQNVTKLERLYLLKAFYNLNLGAILFYFNVELSLKNKQKGIWLAVWVENQRAINFYTKKGFKIVGKYDFQISETHSNPNHIMYFKYL